MGQCPGGTFQNPETVSQDDDLVIRKQTSQKESAARPQGGKIMPGTPDEEEEHERPRRGEEIPTRVMARREESPRSAWDSARGGAFQNPEAASQDDDLVIRKQMSQKGSAAQPQGGKTPPETPDEEEEHERPRRGEETPTRVTAGQEESPQSVLQHRSASHVPAY
ncbi:hypothetical protein NDU88_002061 [Pleurodeles waltl]|uniref:Uncharacterized protein n=1 Tax=Pleurodeles waltl TaxID=8319 RepID=A0AAV7T1B7_PLEWA|nr:hypothetical protein NDU88_002061 [Pleurodeles waltl]